jgi:hypothetical protein
VGADKAYDSVKRTKISKSVNDIKVKMTKI